MSPAPSPLRIVNTTIWAAPGSDRFAGSVLLEDGRIHSVVRDAEAQPPHAGERVIDARGRLLTAGFWNSHVHFTAAHFEDAAERSAEDLSAAATAMLNRYGFTAVVDTGSELANTLALRDRIATHEIAGPRIRTANGSLVPVGGSPAYLDVPLPEVATASDATAAAVAQFEDGADHLKLFAASFIGARQISPLMAEEALRAAIVEAHRRGRLAFAHPQSLRGVELAVAGGIDVLAHTTLEGGDWPPQLVDQIRTRGISLIPTLKLWRHEMEKARLSPEQTDAAQQIGVRQLAAAYAAGVDILFGTDVGYMTDYDPSEEYLRMAEAGMDAASILGSLTANPVRRFAPDSRTPLLESGAVADLALLNADPRDDVRHFADVALTVRDGQVTWDAAS